MSVLGSGSCKLSMSESWWQDEHLPNLQHERPSSRWTVCSDVWPLHYIWPVCVCSQMLWSVLESRAHRCPSPTAHLIQSWPAATRLLPDVAQRHLLSARVPAARLLRTAVTGTEQCWLKRAPERRETAATSSHAKEVKSCLYWVFGDNFCCSDSPKPPYINAEINFIPCYS